MRKFSLYEQDIIRWVVEQSNGTTFYILINAYKDIFYRKKVKYRPNTDVLIFYRDIDTVEDPNEILSVYSEIVETSLLIDYLFKNRYVQVIESADTPIDVIGGFDADRLNPINKPISPEISKILTYSCQNAIFVSQDLKELVDNDFKTIEELSLEEARKQTIAAKESLDLTRESLNESQQQTAAANAALDVSRGALNEAQAQTIKANKSITLSSWAIFISVASLLATVLFTVFYESATVKINNEQVKDILKIDSVKNRGVIDKMDSIELRINTVVKEMDKIQFLKSDTLKK